MRLQKLTAALLVLCLTAALFSGCGKEKTIDISDLNLLTKAMNISVSGMTLDNSTLETQMGAFSGEKGTTLEILFSDAVTVNTVVLNEETDNVVRGFTVEVEQNGDYSLVCQQELIGQMRYCTFDTVSTKAIRVTVTDTADNKSFKISSTSAYDKQNEAHGFTVTAYAIGSDIYDAAYLNAGALKAVTDVVLYGLTSFDATGNIIFSNITSGGKTVGGEAALKQVIKNIRAAEKGAGHSIRLLCSLCAAQPAQDLDDSDKLKKAKGDVLVSAVNDNGDTLAANVLALMKDYKFDGVDFYYDYPVEDKYADTLSDFIVSLSEQSENVFLCAALPVQCVDLKSAAKKALARVEIMAYDAFDSFGNHSPFEGCCVSVIGTYTDAGYSAEQLSLGLPFYGRPADGGAYRYSYSLEAKRLGRYRNAVTGAAPAGADECQTRCYNSCQMIYDKTSYAYDNGLGGVMAWHLGCDVAYGDPLSLFSAIHASIASRTTAVASVTGESS